MANSLGCNPCLHASFVGSLRTRKAFCEQRCAPGRGSQRRPQHQRVCCASSDGSPDATSSLGATLRTCALGLAAAATLCLPMSMMPSPMMPSAEAKALLDREPVKNARALLRYALPINDKYVRQMQRELEGISEALRIPGNKSLGPVARAFRKTESVLGNNKQAIIADFADDKKDDGLRAIANLEEALKVCDKVVESSDKQAIPSVQQNALTYVGQIEEAMMKGFPFEVPSQYDNLPQLKGRAYLEAKIKLKEKRYNNVEGGIMKIVVDGYNAPVTAGAFVDLVEKKFYDGMEVQRSDGLVVQTGRPEGDDEGYRDPNTGEIRRVPFEIMVEGDKVPIYEETLEDVRRFNENPALPFNAFGTLALARAEFDANSGSSQVFFLLKESELTPTGANLLDGRYAVFGYVVDGADLLQECQVGDVIEYIKVTDGGQYLTVPVPHPKSSSGTI
ncbi:TPA: Peptidyl-prolyl cis-trans isomerase, chloroplastic [Trebouxia sp. C0004]